MEKIFGLGDGKILSYPTVKDAMSKNVVTVDAGSTVETACRIMGEKRIGSVIVTKEGKPVGIFTERDLLSKIILRNVDIRDAKVEEFMSKPLITIKPETSLREAARIMAQLHVRRLPVVDVEGRLLGIFTSADLSSALAKYTLTF
ncbi:CBS domain-containing protein [Candidatus Bathyarchaeota archaeon]|nr:MAG: CBS domain-containing protein [Candidatus Bathyarchaeota archaeon]